MVQERRYAWLKERSRVAFSTGNTVHVYMVSDLCKTSAGLLEKTHFEFFKQENGAIHYVLVALTAASIHGLAYIAPKTEYRTTELPKQRVREHAQSNSDHISFSKLQFLPFLVCLFFEALGGYFNIVSSWMINKARSDLVVSRASWAFPRRFYSLFRHGSFIFLTKILAWNGHKLKKPKGHAILEEKPDLVFFKWIRTAVVTW